MQAKGILNGQDSSCDDFWKAEPESGLPDDLRVPLTIQEASTKNQLETFQTLFKEVSIIKAKSWHFKRGIEQYFRSPLRKAVSKSPAVHPNFLNQGFKCHDSIQISLTNSVGDALYCSIISRTRNEQFGFKLASLVL